MARRKADRPVRWAARMIAAIVALSLGLIAVRFVGLDAYVVQGAPTESMVPIGSLVLVAPVSSGAVVAIDDEDNGDASSAPTIGTAWVAIPTLGYAVTYAQSYSPPIVIGLVVWTFTIIAARALAPYMSTARRRLPA